MIASPDALGLESPRIVAEAKHRKGAMDTPTMRTQQPISHEEDRRL